MKRQIIIFGILITTFGLTAFNFFDDQKGFKINDEELRTISFDQKDSIPKYPWVEYTENITPPVNLDLMYEVRGRYNRPVTKEQLQEANLISDFIPHYPSSWVTDYNSVEISTTYKGKDMKVIGPNDVLTKEQKNMFNAVELGADIAILVNHKTENSLTNDIEDRQINILMTVVPYKEAEFIGGYDQMINYFKESSRGKVKTEDIVMFEPFTINFTVNEQGENENIKLIRSSGDAETDKLLLALVTNMPKWKPAENSEGVVVKQQFEFTFGPNGC
jgi:TonB family protein